MIFLMETIEKSNTSSFDLVATMLDGGNSKRKRASLLACSCVSEDITLKLLLSFSFDNNRTLFDVLCSSNCKKHEEKLGA